jgi:osmotically-inducible protein OsmY
MRSEWVALALVAALSLQTGCAGVMGGSPDDQRIAAEARAKLSGYPSLHVSAQGGVVYVVGAVATAGQKDNVERLIREVPGVKGISSDIGVGPYVPTQ